MEARAHVWEFWLLSLSRARALPSSAPHLLPLPSPSTSPAPPHHTTPATKAALELARATKPREQGPGSRATRGQQTHHRVPVGVG